MWTRRRLLRTGAAATGALLPGCPSGPGSLPAAEADVGAFDLGPLGDCAQIEGVIDRFNAADDGIDAVLALYDEGTSPGLMLAAGFHAGMRGLSGDPGGIQHASLGAVAAAMLAGRPGHEPPLVAAAWMGDAMIGALRNATPPAPLDDGALPAGNAAAVLDDALEARDAARAAEAIVGLYRTAGLDAALQALWPWTARYNGFVGHPTILAVLTGRALRWCGAVDPEPGLRQAAVGLTDVNPASTAFLRGIQETAQDVGTDGSTGAQDADAVREILAAARAQDEQQLLARAADLLRAGVGAGSIFTATVLASAELMLRYSGGDLTAVHALDAQNALHNAWALATDPHVRTTLVLAAAAWLPLFRDLASSGADSIWDVELDTLAPAREPGSLGDALDVGLADRSAAAAHVLGWFEGGGTIDEFEVTVRDLVFVKGGDDRHEYKLPFALLEQMRATDPAWRPQLATAVTAYGPAPGHYDGRAYRRVVDHLGE